jgi:hypothetical protein
MSITATTPYFSGVRYLPARPTSGALPDQPAQKSSGGHSQVTEDFLKFAEMSPAEKIRYVFLRQHGLSEDDLKAMGPAERRKIEEEIRQEVRDSIKRNTQHKVGSITDVRV